MAVARAEWAGRIFTIEAIEALGGVGEAGAPVPHAEPGEEDAARNTSSLSCGRE